MKKVSRRTLVQTIVRELLNGADPKQLTKQLAAYLVEQRMTDQVDHLLLDIAAALQTTTGHAAATVTTAFKPTSHNLNELRRSLLHLTGAREVELNMCEDPTLLGGVVVALPGRELDASVRRKLTLLARGGTA
ncbi:MAG TPA: F0F1 ATP synthase subunit delta [Candidatus Saccharimonadales bacterium]|nr:F0F1 ATP synthase subunit delta [Candidatus Saccharimonadales bacterium]